MIKILSIEPFTDEIKVNLLLDMSRAKRHEFLRNNPNRTFIEELCDSTADCDEGYWDLSDAAQERVDREFDLKKINSLKSYLESTNPKDIMNDFIEDQSVETLLNSIENICDCSVNIQITKHKDIEEEEEEVSSEPTDFITFEVPKKRKKK
jgi:hypothetical protein